MQLVCFPKITCPLRLEDLCKASFYYQTESMVEVRGKEKDASTMDKDTESEQLP